MGTCTVNQVDCADVDKRKQEKGSQSDKHDETVSRGF